MAKKTENPMPTAEALSILNEIISSWETINRPFSKNINAHSICLSDTQIRALKICAEQLARDVAKQN